MLDRTGLRLLAVLALLSCSPAVGMTESAFEASPEQHALIVVDARVLQKSLLASQDSPIVKGGLRVRTPGVRKPAHEPSAQAIAEVLPFAVPPGRYRPGSVIARAPRMQVGTGTVDLQIPLPTDSLPGIEQAVAAGTVVYVGRIVITTMPRPFKPNEYRFALAYDRARERAVWEQLLAKAKTGAWEEAIQGRLAALDAVSDTAAVPLVVPADSTR